MRLDHVIRNGSVLMPSIAAKHHNMWSTLTLFAFLMPKYRKVLLDLLTLRCHIKKGACKCDTVTPCWSACLLQAFGNHQGLVLNSLVKCQHPPVSANSGMEITKNFNMSFGQVLKNFTCPKSFERVRSKYNYLLHPYIFFSLLFLKITVYTDCYQNIPADFVVKFCKFW